MSKRYRNVTAVNELSFHVAQQEIFALLGPNGAGKTTTVRMIQGILAPDDGDISFGIDGARGHCRPGLGYLPEDRGLYRDQPIGRILEFFGQLRGMSKADARTETAAWLDRFELGDRQNDKLETLSKGNQQKVQFAAAILHRPALAVLDEPFSGLDPVNQDMFLALLEELRQGGMTILLSAHQMDLVERCVDRLLIIGSGQRLLEGSLHDLRARHASGIRLRVSLENGPPPLTGDDRCVAATSTRGDGSYEVEAQPGVELPALLSAVSQWPGLREVASEQQSLHEIYVNVVEEARAGLATNGGAVGGEGLPLESPPAAESPGGSP